MVHTSPDPKETYIVTELFGCAASDYNTGHAVKHFTHWESGEACILGHNRGHTNEEYHLYWRLYLVPKHVGTKDDPYDPNSKLYADVMDDPANNSKFGRFFLAPKGSKAGDIILPTK
jgi:hypothetical protein